jgi:hypothetical protein
MRRRIMEEETKKVFDYIFHAETDGGYIIVKVDADSKKEAIKIAKAEFEEWGDTDESIDGDSIWHKNMTVYLGKFNYEITEDGNTIMEPGEVIDFSSIQ